MTDEFSLAPATWFAIGYAIVLLSVAYGLDAMARRAAKALERRQNPGFVYHDDHDAWLCPKDQWLWPHSYDPENRVMRYRGSPTICNACPVKDTCTMSSSGREVKRQVDPWPASESARFHRGIACTVTVLAVLWPAITLIASPGPMDSVVLIGVACLVVAASLPLWSHLRKTPADPTGVLVRGSDENVADRLEVAQRYQARKTGYWSDRRLPVGERGGETR